MKRCVCGSNWCEAVDLCLSSWRRGPESENDLHVPSSSDDFLVRDREYRMFRIALRTHRFTAQNPGVSVRNRDADEATRLVREYFDNSLRPESVIFWPNAAVTDEAHHFTGMYGYHFSIDNTEVI